MRSDIFLIGGVLFLAGCGGGDNATGEANAAADAGVANATDVAAPAIEAPKIDCDAVKPQTAPKGEPADDILGVRQGMTLDQVKGVLQCKNANYAINTNTNTLSLPEGGQMSRINLNADTGLDKVNVWLVGPPGGEQVVHVDRATEYAAGQEIALESITQELAAKYGSFDAPYGNNSGLIVRSRDGQRMSKDNSSYGECSNHDVRTDRVLPCLNVVTFEVKPSQQNPALASGFGVAVTNQARVAQMAELTRQQQTQAVERAKETAKEKGLEL